MARVASEIDFAVAQAGVGTDSATASISPVTIYQSYGIVQTGAGSLATMTVALGAEERRVIEGALDAVERVIDAAGDTRELRATVELVRDVRQEMERPEPNSLRIRGALQGIATTVQTMGSAAGAYQLLKGAAALFGLTLP